MRFYDNTKSIVTIQQVALAARYREVAANLFGLANDRIEVRAK